MKAEAKGFSLRPSAARRLSLGLRPNSRSHRTRFLTLSTPVSSTALLDQPPPSLPPTPRASDGRLDQTFTAAVNPTRMSGKGRESWGSMRTGARLPSTMNPSLCVSLLSVGFFDVVEDLHSDPRGAYRVVSSHHSQIHKKKLKPAQINKEQQLGSVCVDGRPRKQTQNKT